MRAAIIAMLPAALAGCANAPAGTEAATEAPFTPDYRGSEIVTLDASLVNVFVEMGGARGPDDLSRYADCAAAGHALARGDGFVRHVRTLIRATETAGISRADAVYTISPDLPRGLRTIDAEVTVADCDQSDIPTA